MLAGVIRPRRMGVDAGGELPADAEALRSVRDGEAGQAMRPHAMRVGEVRPVARRLCRGRAGGGPDMYMHDAPRRRQHDDGCSHSQRSREQTTPVSARAAVHRASPKRRAAIKSVFPNAAHPIGSCQPKGPGARRGVRSEALARSFGERMVSSSRIVSPSGSFARCDVTVGAIPAARRLICRVTRRQRGRDRPRSRSERARATRRERPQESGCFVRRRGCSALRRRRCLCRVAWWAR